VRSEDPAVFRGLASGWPAVGTWTLPLIAEMAPELPVQLVVGNREEGDTRLVQSTLGAYLSSFSNADTGDPHKPYLKEFNLLKNIPGLRRDVSPETILPKGVVTDHSAWIGPAGARTGLHFDLLDNIAVTLVGTKRFNLAPPHTVEALGGLSKKHDKWARLSTLSFDDLASRGATGLRTVDLHPGDALFVPAGWWHEVVNVTDSVLLSGFFGRPHVALGVAVRAYLRHARHLMRSPRRRNCTCHTSSARSLPTYRNV
jgi:lysine-specific demethylase 8